MDSSISNANYATIATEFQSLELAAWITTSYFLALSSGQPLYGKLSDVFGRKPCILFAFSTFALGCLLCGLAQSMQQFIAARVVQGCGGAGIATLITVLLSDVIPLEERAPWQGYLNLINAAGLSLGAPIGGLFADTIGWRWTFYVQVPLTCLAVLSVFFFLHVPSPNNEATEASSTRLKRIDFLGAALLVLAVVALLLGLDRASAVAWSHPSCYVPLALTPIFILAFILTERFLAADPIIPLAVIRSRTPLSVYANNFFMYGAWSALLFFIPLFYQAVDGVSAAQAGVRLLPAIILAVSGAVFGGYAIRYRGRYYRLALVSGAATALAMAPVLVATWVARRDVLLVSVGIGLNSFFYGIMAVVSLIALISTVSAAQQATATTTMFLARSLGSAVAISLGGSLLQHVLRTRLHAALDNVQDGWDADSIVEGVRRSLKYLNALDPAVRELVKEGYAQAVRAVMWAVTGGFAIAWVAVWWIVEVRKK